MTTLTNKDIVDAWSSTSEEYVSGVGDDGDFSRQHLLNPAFFSLIGDINGKKILDAGSGNGYLSRKLAKKGAIVTGLEPSKSLFLHSSNREKEDVLGIIYIQEDLSQWKNVSEEFDIVVSNMVFMDIPDYKSAIKNCIKALKQNGLFVFSILHPSFEDQLSWKTQKTVQTSEYFNESETKQFVGYSFHRTLSAYMNFVIDEGCKIEKIIEPQLPEILGKQFTSHERDVHVPSFIVISSTKMSCTEATVGNEQFEV